VKWMTRGEKNFVCTFSGYEPGCLVIQMETEPAEQAAPDAATRLTVRNCCRNEITYRICWRRFGNCRK
jgi:hypothetical protein